MKNFRRYKNKKLEAIEDKLEDKQSIKSFKDIQQSY